ncbi:MAG: hypothetical protein RLZZ592_2861 [Pseudomonadota bacterium]|jgi:DNA-binding transcriptional LysR family regulator
MTSRPAPPSADLLRGTQADELSALLALRAHGSLAGAARQLQRHPSVLSRRLDALERRLGVRLVERSTRRLRFTEAGQQLADRLGEANRLIADAQAEAARGAAEVRGRLRLALPAAMGRRLLGPMIAEFALAHPQISLEVHHAERRVDLIGEGFDAAIRVGSLDDSRLTALKLHEHRRLLCAAPAYLARRGRPQDPDDLARHNLLGFTGLASHPHWRLRRDGQLRVVPVHGSLSGNDNEALLGAACLGVGVLIAGDWLVAPHLADGSLEPVLPDWQPEGDGAIHLVRPSARFTSAAMEAFRQWMLDGFARTPWAPSPRPTSPTL